MLTVCGFAASRFAGPAFGCPAAFGLVFAAARGGAQCASGGRARTGSNMLDAAITELSLSLRAKRFSSVELARASLDRIAALDPALNAFIPVDP